MVKRRKVLIGVGSLAAGSAAAMSTGAFTQATAERAVNAAVVADENAFLRLSASASSLDNKEYATGTGNGKLKLTFNSGAGVSGEGLNPDSEYYFDNVFQIENFGDDQVRIDIDKSGMDNPDAFTFYPLYRTQQNKVIGGRDSDFNVGITVGDGINIGVKIETPEQMPPAPWESGTIEITATDTSEVSGNQV
jgi:hypothetical protein